MMILDSYRGNDKDLSFLGCDSVSTVRSSCLHFEGPSVSRSADDLRAEYGVRSVLQSVGNYLLINTEPHPRIYYIKKYIKLSMLILLLYTVEALLHFTHVCFTTYGKCIPSHTCVLKCDTLTTITLFKNKLQRVAIYFRSQMGC